MERRNDDITNLIVAQRKPWPHKGTCALYSEARYVINLLLIYILKNRTMEAQS